MKKKKKRDVRARGHDALVRGKEMYAREEKLKLLGLLTLTQVRKRRKYGNKTPGEESGKEETRRRMRMIIKVEQRRKKAKVGEMEGTGRRGQKRKRNPNNKQNDALEKLQEKKI